MGRRWRGASGWAFALTLLLSVAFALTPAGTVIRNQAVAEASGERYLSNVAETRVQAVCRPLLFPDGTPEAPALRASAAPGGWVHLPYRLKNGGNAPYTFALSHVLHGTSSWVPEAVRFYLDVNANALSDPGEPEVSEVALGMGEEVALVLALKVPATASGSLFITPVATCPGGEEDGENYARVEASGILEPSLFLAKAASPAALLPGERATFTLTLRNLGTGEARGPILLSDPLAGLEGLRYVPGSARAPKGILEFFDGAAWRTEEPPSVLGVRLRLERLLPGEEPLQPEPDPEHGRRFLGAPGRAVKELQNPLGGPGASRHVAEPFQPRKRVTEEDGPPGLPGPQVPQGEGEGGPLPGKEGSGACGLGEEEAGLQDARGLHPGVVLPVLLPPGAGGHGGDEEASRGGGGHLQGQDQGHLLPHTQGHLGHLRLPGVGEGVRVHVQVEAHRLGHPGGGSVEDVAQGEGVGGVPPVFQAVGEVDPAPRSGARPQGRGLRGSVGKEKGTADRLDPGLRHVGEVALPRGLRHRLVADHRARRGEGEGDGEEEGEGERPPAGSSPPPSHSPSHPSPLT